MILTFIHRVRNAVYDFRMESVWQAYGTRAINLLPTKVNASAMMTQGGQNFNKFLNTSDQDGSQR